jgi:DNA-binding XRE family transcriptional regulator
LQDSSLAHGAKSVPFVSLLRWRKPNLPIDATIDFRIFHFVSRPDWLIFSDIHEERSGDLPSFGARLRTAREVCRMTQDAAAKELGLSRSAVVCSDRGGPSTVSASSFHRLAYLFGRDIRAVGQRLPSSMTMGWERCFAPSRRVAAVGWS